MPPTRDRRRPGTIRRAQLLSRNGAWQTSLGTLATRAGRHGGFLGTLALDHFETEIEKHRIGRASDAREQRLRAAPADLQSRQSQAGEAGDRVLQDIQVVEAGDRNSAGDFPATPLRLEERADGEDVA